MVSSRVALVIGTSPGFGQANSRFAQLVNYRSAFQPGTRRFDVGERSNFILLPMGIAALQQVLQWGVPTIDSTLRELTARIEDMATSLGFQTAPGCYRMGHMLGLRHPAGLPTGLASELTKANIFVSMRGVSIRISPHLYNTKNDVASCYTCCHG